MAQSARIENHMEIKDIIALIEAVSSSKLTSFTYEEGETKLSFELDHELQGSSASKVVAATAISEQSCIQKENVPCNIITSPMVGTFYHAKGEGEEPFIQVGDRVFKGQVVGIVEAMKLMNEIESPYDGIVEEILVKNQEMVGFEQKLVRIRPLS